METAKENPIDLNQNQTVEKDQNLHKMTNSKEDGKEVTASEALTNWYVQIIDSVSLDSLNCYYNIKVALCACLSFLLYDTKLTFFHILL